MGRIAFKTAGGDGPDLVLIHGFGADRLTWVGTSPALMTQARVHVLDLPGHGESLSDGVADFNPSSLSQQVLSALDEHGIARAHLLGHSLGGSLAMLMSLEAPQRVASLTLLAPAGLGRGIDHDFLLRYPELSGEDETTALLQRLVARPQLINRLMVKRVLDQLARPGARDALRRVAAGVIAAETLLPDIAARVAAAHVPRLVIFGADDRINPPEALALARFGGDQLLLPEVGHLPHAEAARAVNARISSFLLREAN